jgi:hypothetical protein
MNWYDSFDQTPANGVLPSPQGAYASHAVAVYDEDGMLLIKSWRGAGFGNGGYGYLTPDNFSKTFTAAYGFEPDDRRHPQCHLPLRGGELRDGSELDAPPITRKGP